MPDNAATETLWSIKQVAAFLGVNRGTVYNMLRRGELEAVQVGARQKFSPTYVISKFGQRQLVENGYNLAA